MRGEDASEDRMPVAWQTTPSGASESAHGERLEMLLAEIERNPEGTLSEPFIRRAADLPLFMQAKLRVAVKATKADLGAYDGALRSATKVAAKAKRAQEERADREARADAAAVGKARIGVGPDIDRVTAEAVTALAQHPDVYQRAGSLVRVLRDLSPEPDLDADGERRRGPRDAKDAPRIALIAPAQLKVDLSSVAAFVAQVEEGPVAVHVPEDVVRAVHARGQWGGIRTLEGVVECPMLRPDGTVLETPGYDLKTGLLYMPSEAFPPVPDRPTPEQVAGALAVLFDLVADFPFKERCHRSAWLSALLTCFARFAFPGPSPFFGGAHFVTHLRRSGVTHLGLRGACLAPWRRRDRDPPRVTS